MDFGFCVLGVALSKQPPLTLSISVEISVLCLSFLKTAAENVVVHAIIIHNRPLQICGLDRRSVLEASMLNSRSNSQPMVFF